MEQDKYSLTSLEDFTSALTKDEPRILGRGFKSSADPDQFLEQCFYFLGQSVGFFVEQQWESLESYLIIKCDELESKMNPEEREKAITQAFFTPLKFKQYLQNLKSVNFNFDSTQDLRVVLPLPCLELKVCYSDGKNIQILDTLIQVTRVGENEQSSIRTFDYVIGKESKKLNADLLIQSSKIIAQLSYHYLSQTWYIRNWVSHNSVCPTFQQICKYFSSYIYEAENPHNNKNGSFLLQVGYKLFKIQNIQW